MDDCLIRCPVSLFLVDGPNNDPLADCPFDDSPASYFSCLSSSRYPVVCPQVDV